MNRQRGFSNTATILLALLAALLVAPLFMTWVVVDVQTYDEDAVNLKLPIPLALARIGLAFAPDHEIRQPVPADFTAQREHVLAMLRDLESCPDTELVSVDAPDARVRIVKKGDLLQLDVDADDAVVHGAIPVDAVLRALERWDWETFDPKLALDIVAAAGHGELLSVEAEDATVKIRVW